ncbi:PLP-dependent transferase [Neurospora crassa]|uniref:Cystathionine gamma-synthase n=2 Tax=Neurospora crassa TaxID=5141 RepID=Q1K5P0_NEUCR|nr:cystathionine gamma-synthase [Neurospora crassa OR74A]EAA27843.1 cystathionine gamma-synthase [Neurospora crassa OR74A]KHE87963.1 PLP-dependent transferase [Neurospora crassa]CAD70419.1 related to O-succinylhomoserine (thiol)-lyase met-7 chain [Neurospora crassa]|eukprot:XP_957079.1 cystathionine gamma-synthase [Neurospora crassa OR74A]
MAEKGIIEHPELLKLGEPLPPGNPHGISVHLPTWEDTLGWAKRDPRVVDTMKTGYPRFFIPRVVERLADRLLEHFTQIHSHSDSGFDLKNKHALIVSTGHHALMCRHFFRQKFDPASDQKVTFPILIAHWDGTISAVREHEHDLPTIKAQPPPPPPPPLGQEDIFLVPYPTNMFPFAKSFWQHTGFGISSRRATYWMDSAPFFFQSTPPTSTSSDHQPNPPTPTPFDESTTTTALSLLRTRLAKSYSSLPSAPVSPSDIFLYPTGMSSTAALSTAIKSLVLSTSTPSDPPRIPSVALFGFLYVDTLKLLSVLLGFHLHLFPYSTPLSSLSESLESGDLQIDLLVTEFPGNPLMQSPDVSCLYEMSRRHGFALVVDDTVGGTGANVNVLGRCDAVVSSLTKMVSGGCDVMGGCLVLNPEGGRYAMLKGMLEGGNDPMEGNGNANGEVDEREEKKRDSGYADDLNGEAEGEETKEEVKGETTSKQEGAQRREEERAWFPADIAVMERNSRDFVHRVRKASANAEWLVHNLLRPHASVQEVYYPKGSSTEDIYEQFRVKPTDESPEEEGGYGFLVSIKFLTPAKARAFYDAMAVAKGPSLGTNFTLCCAYTLLAHYRELEWAAEFGVVEDLVRISVGLEEKEWLGERVSRALKAAGECDE